MSLRTLEAAILRSLRVEAKKPRLRQEDIKEWCTGKIAPREDEQVFWVPDPGVFVAVKKEALR